MRSIFLMSLRTASIDVEAVATSASFQARVPTFHARYNCSIIRSINYKC